jgi:hypothetical protein
MFLTLRRKPSSAARPPRRRQARLGLESLETRLVPATIGYTLHFADGGANATFTDRTNLPATMTASANSNDVYIGGGGNTTFILSGGPGGADVFVGGSGTNQLIDKVVLGGQ